MTKRNPSDINLAPQTSVLYRNSLCSFLSNRFEYLCGWKGVVQIFYFLGPFGVFVDLIDHNGFSAQMSTLLNAFVFPVREPVHFRCVDVPCGPDLTVSDPLHRTNTRIRDGHTIRGLKSVGIDEVQPTWTVGQRRS